MALNAGSQRSSRSVFNMKSDLSELVYCVVSTALPFDVSRHPATRSHVAQDMLARMTTDAREFGEVANAAKSPRFSGFTDADLAAVADDLKKRAKQEADAANNSDSGRGGGRAAAGAKSAPAASAKS